MFNLAAVVLAVAAAAVAAPAAGCKADSVGSSVYFSDRVRVSFGAYNVIPGQSIAAQLVDIKTCEPFTGSFATTELSELSGTVADAKLDWTTPGGFSAANATGSLLTAFAGVPNGAQDLTFTASATFSPGGFDNWKLVKENLGVIFTAA